MKLTAIYDPSIRGALVHVVQKLQDELVRDQETQQMRIAPARQNPKQSRAVEMGTLLSERAERVATCLRVWDYRRSPAPVLHLVGDRPQPPEQLASRGSGYGPDLCWR